MFVKRVLFFLVCLLTVCFFAASTAESDMPAPEDFAAYDTWIRGAAQRDGYYEVAPAAEGYALRFQDFVLYADRMELTEETVLSAVVLDTAPEEDVYPDFRGVCVGMPAREALSRYPFENPSLAGTREEAGLCVAGAVPGRAFTGVLYRDGQTLLSAVYTLYEMADGGVKVYSIEYVFFQGEVSAVRVSLQPGTVSVQAAQQAFGECADRMNIREYSAFLTGSSRPAEPFQQEDLLFSGIDFLGLTPRFAQKMLGAPKEETWVSDSGGWLLTLSWQGLSVTFVCDAEKQPLYAAGFFLEEDLLEGPRGLMPGVSLADILSRFPGGENASLSEPGGGELYSLEDGSSGWLETPVDGLATVRYICPVEDGTVLLRLYTESGVLQNLTLQRTMNTTR